MKLAWFPGKTRPDPELEHLKAELDRAQEDLRQAYHHLDLVLEPELVEACIYQICSIQARCNYLIRTIKARHNGTAAVPTKEGAAWT